MQFAIRPNIRNHSILTRDSIIRQVATVVGSGHQVDLKLYDLLILVEVYKVSMPNIPLVGLYRLFELVSLMWALSRTFVG